MRFVSALQCSVHAAGPVSSTAGAGTPPAASTILRPAASMSLAVRPPLYGFADAKVFLPGGKVTIVGKPLTPKRWASDSDEGGGRGRR